MGGADDPLVVARLGGHDRARPTDREPVGLELLRVGALEPEIERHLRVDACDDELARRTEPAVAEILAAEAVRPAAAVVGRRAAVETGDEIGDRVAELPRRQPRELDAGRTVAVAGDRRIEGGVDEGGDLSRGVARDERWIVLRHRVVNVVGQLRHRAVTLERGGDVRRAAAVLAVAADAMLAVDRQPGMIGQGGLAGQAHDQPRRNQRGRNQPGSGSHRDPGPRSGGCGPRTAGCRNVQTSRAHDSAPGGGHIRVVSGRAKTSRPAVVCRVLVTPTCTVRPIWSRPLSTTTIVPSSR